MGRLIWLDHRIPCTVSCASIGCPNLYPVAYTAASLESPLAEVIRNYSGSIQYRYEGNLNRP